MTVGLEDLKIFNRFFRCQRFSQVSRYFRFLIHHLPKLPFPILSLATTLVCLTNHRECTVPKETRTSVLQLIDGKIALADLTKKQRENTFCSLFTPLKLHCHEQFIESKLFQNNLEREGPCFSFNCINFYCIT